MRYLSIRNRVYPKNLNPNGYAFGGFIMAEMDKAASIMVEEVMHGKAVTVFVDNLHFQHPVRNGDIISIYAEVTKIGKTSITLHISFETRCVISRDEYSVCDALFVFVAINDQNKPIPIRPLLRDNIPDYIQALVSK
ncbi:MAG TPA: acyl-CoA thioesterase [Epsilonproteobacteria bacterium]|nr:acyl-CoA thioesterase [Campylobacterota bacterium]